MTGSAPPAFPRHALGWVLVVALVARLVAIAAVGFDRLDFGDAHDYRAFAAAICAGEGYPERGNLPFFRAPGLPFFIALATACETEARVGWAKVALAIVDTLNVGLIFLLARRFGLGRRLALAVAAAAALHPFFVAQVTDLRSEPLAMVLTTLSLVLLLRYRTSRGLGSLFASGAALGFAALVRPPSLVALVAWMVFVWIDSAGAPVRARALRAAAVGLGLVLVVLPWTARNRERFGEWLLINDAAGYNFWRSTLPELDRLLATSDPQEFERSAVYLEGELTERVAREATRAAATPGARERWYWHRGFEQIGTHPGRWARLLLRDAVDFWRPWLDPVARGWRMAIASGLLLVPLFLLAARGLLRLRLEDRSLAILVIVLFVVITVAHSPFQAIVRYRLPLAEPLLMVLAARGIARRPLAGRARGVAAEVESGRQGDFRHQP
ncbi:MAG: glycosyltransferase family 39 protein [Thermoanaerobaculia bacterium]